MPPFLFSTVSSGLFFYLSGICHLFETVHLCLWSLVVCYL